MFPPNTCPYTGCGAPTQIVVEEHAQLFQVGSESQRFTAPIQVVHCTKHPHHDIVTGPSREMWEKSIATQLIQVPQPTPEMYTFVRKAYGVAVPTCAWLIQHAALITPK